MSKPQESQALKDQPVLAIVAAVALFAGLFFAVHKRGK
jgi:hypothetical protein